VKLSRDGWGGLAVLAASLFLFSLTLGLKESPLVPIGPGFYPRIVLGLTALLSLWLLIADFYSQKQVKEKEELNYRLVALMFAAFGLYCALMPLLGFRVSTVLYVAACGALLEPPVGWKGWARVLSVALLTSFLSHLVFERYLSVLLPRGSWTAY